MSVSNGYRCEGIGSGWGCTCVGEDDVGDGFEAFGETDLLRDVHLLITRLLDADAYHGDHHSADDRHEANNSHIADIFKCTRQCADQTNDQSRDSEHDRACPVAGDRVHHDGEGQDVAAHDEDKKHDLCGAKYFSPDGPEHHVASVSHIMDARVCEFELTDYVASVGRDDAEASN